MQASVLPLFPQRPMSADTMFVMTEPASPPLRSGGTDGADGCCFQWVPGRRVEAKIPTENDDSEEQTSSSEGREEHFSGSRRGTGFPIEAIPENTDLIPASKYCDEIRVVTLARDSLCDEGTGDKLKGPQLKMTTQSASKDDGICDRGTGDEFRSVSLETTTRVISEDIPRYNSGDIHSVVKLETGVVTVECQSDETGIQELETALKDMELNYRGPMYGKPTQHIRNGGSISDYLSGQISEGEDHGQPSKYMKSSRSAPSFCVAQSALQMTPNGLLSHHITTSPSFPFQFTSPISSTTRNSSFLDSRDLLHSPNHLNQFTSQGLPESGISFSYPTQIGVQERLNYCNYPYPTTMPIIPNARLPVIGQMVNQTMERQLDNWIQPETAAAPQYVQFSRQIVDTNIDVNASISHIPSGCTSVGNDDFSLSSETLYPGLSEKEQLECALEYINEQKEEEELAAQKRNQRIQEVQYEPAVETRNFLFNPIRDVDVPSNGPCVQSFYQNQSTSRTSDRLTSGSNSSSNLSSLSPSNNYQPSPCSVITFSASSPGASSFCQETSTSPGYALITQQASSLPSSVAQPPATGNRGSSPRYFDFLSPNIEHGTTLSCVEELMSKQRISPHGISEFGFGPESLACICPGSVSSTELESLGNSPYSCAEIEQIVDESREERFAKIAEAEKTAESYLDCELISQDEQGDTPLHLAMVDDDWFLAEAILKRLIRDNMIKQVINVRNNFQQTPLCLAVICNKSGITEMLVENGADVNVHIKTSHDNLGPKFCQPLHLAASRCHLWKETLRQLIKAQDIELDNFNSDGKSALHCAIEAHGRKFNDAILDCKGTLRVLAERGANLNQPDCGHEKTPLHYAIERRDVELVSRLLTLASKFSPDRERSSISQMLEAKTGNGNTALHLAASVEMNTHEHKKLVQQLMCRGADPSSKNSDGFLPREVTKNREIVELLKGRTANGRSPNMDRNRCS